MATPPTKKHPESDMAKDVNLTFRVTPEFDNMIRVESGKLGMDMTLTPNDDDGPIEALELTRQSRLGHELTETAYAELVIE